MGTTFDLYFPASTKTRVRPQAAISTQVAPRGTETILLVDDEVMIRDLTSAMLKRLGFRVCLATDGVQALETHSKRGDDIDAILLDASMPRMDGRECLTHLLGMDDKVRILLSSGHDLKAESDAQLAQGVIGIIQKPYHLTELARRLREILDL